MKDRDVKPVPLGGQYLWEGECRGGMQRVKEGEYD
jgi:hypothetical protein